MPSGSGLEFCLWKYVLVWLMGAGFFLLLNPLAACLINRIWAEENERFSGAGDKGGPSRDKPGRRHCRMLKGKFSLRPLAMGFLGGLTALLCAAYGGFAGGISGLWLMLFFGLLAVAAVVDQETMEIPDCLPMAVGLLSVAAMAGEPNLLLQISLGERLSGLFSVSVPMLLLALAVPGAFGGGDIKLMAACGMFLGWKLNVLALFFAVMAGGLWGIWLLARGKAGRKDFFAFGPFLCMGMAAAVFWGDALLGWYCRAFLP